MVPKPAKISEARLNTLKRRQIRKSGRFWITMRFNPKDSFLEFSMRLNLFFYQKSIQNMNEKWSWSLSL